MKFVRIMLVTGLAAMAAACVPKAQTPPPPKQQPPAAPRPAAPPPPPPQARADWQYAPLSTGSWVYRNQGGTAQALFGPPSGAASFMFVCDRANNQVRLMRQGVATGNVMTVRTTSGARNFPMTAQGQPSGYVGASLSNTDRFLDTIAFSRGRFAIEVPGMPVLLIPSWAEPARVIEDCR